MPAKKKPAAKKAPVKKAAAKKPVAKKTVAKKKCSVVRVKRDKTKFGEATGFSQILPKQRAL
jgi:hypothetical protein